MQTVLEIARELQAAIVAADAAGFSVLECHVPPKLEKRFNAATYLVADRLPGIVCPERIIEDWEWTPGGYSPRYYVSIRPSRPDWEEIKNESPDHFWL